MKNFYTCIFLLVICALPCLADELVLSTYYPAPNGRYVDMTVTGTLTVQALTINGSLTTGNLIVNGTLDMTIGPISNVTTLQASGLITARGASLTSDLNMNMNNINNVSNILGLVNLTASGTVQAGTISSSGNVSATQNIRANGTIWAGGNMSTSANFIAAGSVWGNTVSANSISSNGSISGNIVSANGISSNGSVWGNSVSGNNITANTNLWGTNIGCNNISAVSMGTQNLSVGNFMSVPNLSVGNNLTTGGMASYPQGMVVYGWISANGSISTGTGFFGPSDIRLKKDILTIDNALDKILTLRGVSFFWKDPQKGTARKIGVIAQEVEKVFPEVVKTNPDGYKFISYGDLAAPLIEAVKTLSGKIDALSKENLELKKRIETLETKQP